MLINFHYHRTPLDIHIEQSRDQIGQKTFDYIYFIQKRTNNKRKQKKTGNASYHMTPNLFRIMHTTNDVSNRNRCLKKGENTNIFIQFVHCGSDNDPLVGFRQLLKKISQQIIAPSRARWSNQLHA